MTGSRAAATSAAVQIFGVKSSPAVRAAERFFKERRVLMHFVDLRRKPMAPGEIGRFIDHFGLAGLLDTVGKPYADAGLAYLRPSDSDFCRESKPSPGCCACRWFVPEAGLASVTTRPPGRQCWP